LVVRHLQLELTAHAMHNLNIFLKFYKNRNKTHVRLPRALLLTRARARVSCVLVPSSLLISELL
jgi:hypothetical protein